MIDQTISQKQSLYSKHLLTASEEMIPAKFFKVNVGGIVSTVGRDQGSTCTTCMHILDVVQKTINQDFWLLSYIWTLSIFCTFMMMLIFIFQISEYATYTFSPVWRYKEIVFRFRDIIARNIIAILFYAN